MRPEVIVPLKVHRCLRALVTGTEVHVVTATRDVRGMIYEVGRSPFHNDFRARLVEGSGKVHYFRPERSDCTVEFI